MKERELTISEKRGIYGYLLISPFIIGFVFLFLRPFVQTIIFSFSKIILNSDGFTLSNVGLSNYRHIIFIDTTFKRALVESTGTLLYEIPLILMFSLFMATILNLKIRGRVIIRAILFLPVIISSGILLNYEINTYLQSAFESGFAREGSFTGNILNNLMLKNMIERNFSEFLLNFNIRIGRNLNLNLLISSESIKNIINIFDDIFRIIGKSGVQIIMFLAALQSIPGSIFEASRIEGATAWEDYWLIIVPMISPFILTNAVYTIIDSFTRTDNSVMEYLKSTAMKSIDGISYGTAMAAIYFIVIALLLGIIWLISSKWVFYSDK